MTSPFAMPPSLRFALVWGTILAIDVAAHAIVARWVLATWPRVGRLRITLITAGVIVLGPLARVLAHLTHASIATELFAVTTLETVAVVVAAPLVLLTSLAARTVPASRGSLSRRQLLEATSGAVVMGASSAALGYGAARGRHELVVEELVVRVPGWPRVLDGYSIAQISDVHGGPFVGDAELAAGLERLRAMKTDLVVFTGDLVDLDPAEAPKVAAALASLTPRDGVVGILGNHDYYAGAEAVLAAARAAKLDMLVNGARVIRPADGGGFALLGVDEYSAVGARGAGAALQTALDAAPPELPRLLLAHQPAFIDHAAGKVALQLSGHTHGGQINPGFCPASLVLRYVSGRYDVKGTTLYVNRGFGVSGPPSRVQAPPELTRIIVTG